MMTNEAIEKKRQIASKNQQIIYKCIYKNPGITIYQISKKIKWSPGKIKHHVNILLEHNKIKKQNIIINGRNNSLYFPKENK